MSDITVAAAGAVTSGSTSAEEWAAQPPEKAPHMVIRNIGELVAARGLG